MPESPWRCAYCLRTAAYVRRRGSSPVCDRCRDALAARGLKFCRGCGRPRPVAQFDRVAGPGGTQRRAACKPCRLRQLGPWKRDYLIAWRARNRERWRGYFRNRDPERQRQYRRASYLRRKMRQSAALAQRHGPGR
jgi:hypothetical protein